MYPDKRFFKDCVDDEMGYFFEEDMDLYPDSDYYPDNKMPQLRLAQAYIPNQPYVGIVSPEEALKRGSSFPNLYQPYKYKSKY